MPAGFAGNDFAGVSPDRLRSAEYARELDGSDRLGLHHPGGRRLPVVHREKFVFPTKGEVRSRRSGSLGACVVNGIGAGAHLDDDGEQAVYLCGHSQGLEPRRDWHTETSEGRDGNLDVNDPETISWLDQDVVVRKQMADIVGALPEEVALMYSDMAMNLHFALQNFYKPNKRGRRKIIIESSMFSAYKVGSKSRASSMQSTKLTWHSGCRSSPHGEARYLKRKPCSHQTENA